MKPLYRAKDCRFLAMAGLILAVVVNLVSGNFEARAQVDRDRQDSRTSHSRDGMTPEAREMVELASVVVCKERLADAKGSVPIDDMQGRPSLPVQSPEALAGAQRAQRLLPIAKELVVASLQQLAKEYKLSDSGGTNLKIRRAINRVEAVRNIR